MEEFARLVGIAVMGVALVVFIAVFTAWPVQVLWNWLMPELFGLKSISFVQALGLSVLCSTLFKSSSSTSSGK